MGLQFIIVYSKINENGAYCEMVAKEMTKRREVLFPEGIEWDPTRFDS